MSEYCKNCYKLTEENEKLKEELNRYKEMEAKGLEEFKDVGGCWGCGLQLQLEQDIKDLKKYGQENVELLQENAKLKNKHQEELTVNTQLRKWQDEDLRQIAQLEKELDLFRKLHNNEQAQRRIFEAKLEKIKEIAKENNICEGFGCIPMYKILKVIEGAEDE